MMDLESSTPAPTITIPSSGETSGPVVPSCCATASLPPDVVRSWLRDRRVLAAAGLAVGGSGLALGWNWLTAIGIAPLILSAAPCLVMCALGVCMMGRGHGTGSGKPESAPGSAVTPTDDAASQ